MLDGEPGGNYGGDIVYGIQRDNPDESYDIEQNIKCFEEAGFPEELLLELILQYGPELIADGNYSCLVDYYEECMEEGVECGKAVLGKVIEFIKGQGERYEERKLADIDGGDFLAQSVSIHRNQDDQLDATMLLANKLRIEADLWARRMAQAGWHGADMRGNVEENFEEMEDIRFYERERFLDGVNMALDKGLIENMDQLREITALVISFSKMNPEGVKKLLDKAAISSYRTLRYLLKLGIHEGFPASGINHITYWLNLDSLENVSDEDLERSFTVQVLKDRPDDLFYFLVAKGARGLHDNN